MSNLIQNRREFLSVAVAGVAMVPVIRACGSATAARATRSGKLNILRKHAIQDPACEWWGAKDVPDDVNWKTTLYREGDVGEQMIIDGTVYEPDGKTLARDTLLYIYHTDSEGHYGRKGEHRHGRYRGWMLTGEDGRYQFWTIRPAPYPNRNISAHVHMTVTGLDRKEDWVDSIKFEGDQLLKPGEMSSKKGGFRNVIRLAKDSEGIWRGTRNLILPPL